MDGLLEEVRLALRQSDDGFDREIGTLIGAAKARMRAAGVRLEKLQGEALSLARACVCLYAKANFGRLPPEEKQDLMAAFDSLSATLALAKKSLEESE